MTELLDSLQSVLTKYSLVTAFAVIGVTTWVSYFLSARLTRGRFHGSAIAILIGLLLAYVGGIRTGGGNGIADIEALSSIDLGSTKIEVSGDITEENLRIYNHGAINFISSGSLTKHLRAVDLSMRFVS